MALETAEDSEIPLVPVLLDAATARSAAAGPAGCGREWWPHMP
jgi:hypothetical protein